MNQEMMLPILFKKNDPKLTYQLIIIKIIIVIIIQGFQIWAIQIENTTIF